MFWQKHHSTAFHQSSPITDGRFSHQHNRIQEFSQLTVHIKLLQSSGHLTRAFFEMFGLAWKRTRRVTRVDEPVLWDAGFWLAASAAAAPRFSWEPDTTDVSEVLLKVPEDPVIWSPSAASKEDCLPREAFTAATGTTIFWDDVWRVIACTAAGDDGQVLSDMWLGDNRVHEAVITLLPMSLDEDIAQIILKSTGNNKSTYKSTTCTITYISSPKFHHKISICCKTMVTWMKLGQMLVFSRVY